MNDFRLIRLLLPLLFVFTACAGPGRAQTGAASDDEAVLYAGLINNKGHYVVGAALVGAGLHRHLEDTTWAHLGWLTPRIVGISADPTDPDAIFVASGNGVLRTLDGGDSWRITTDWRVTEVQDVAVDPSRPEHVYLASAYGVWRTEDRGATWQEANDGLPKRYTQTIEVDRTRARRVFAGTEGGLYASEDGGRTWTLVTAPVAIMDLQQSPTEPDVWLAGAEHDGLWRSEDGGQTWTQAAGTEDGQFYAVAIDPFDAGHMAAGGWDTGVVVSADGGATWTRRTDGLPVPHIYELIFDANEPGRLLAATVERGLFATTDDGASWTYEGLDGTLVFDMLYVPAP